MKINLRKIATMSLSFALLLTTATIQAKQTAKTTAPTKTNAEKTVKVDSSSEDLPPQIKALIDDVEIIYAIYKKGDMNNLVELSQRCYKEVPGSVDCVYVDATAYLIDKKINKSTGKKTVGSYFTKKEVDTRLAKNYYQPNGFSAKDQQDHWEAMEALIGKVLDVLEKRN